MEERLACGFNHTVAVDASGSVWCCGSNGEGQLGADIGTGITVPTRVPGLDVQVISVFCGPKYTMCIDSNDDVWSFGLNKHGQLGLGDKQNRARPERVPNLPPIAMLSCGEGHVFFLGTDSSLYCVGRNDFGQLGLGNKTPEELEIQKHSITNVFKICCGYYHTIIINGDRNVLSTGNNQYGQLGLGGRSFFNKKKDRTSFTEIPEFTNISDVSCGGYHTLFLKSDGKLFGCGQNYNGQLGLGGCHLKTSPTLIIGLPEIQFINTGGSNNICTSSDGFLWGFGINSGGTRRTKPAQIHEVSEVANVVTGEGHTIFTTENGSVWCFGRNDYGQLGLRNYDSTPEPIQMAPVMHEILSTRVRNKAKSARK